MNSKDKKADAELFRDAMTGVKPLPPDDRIDPVAKRPPPRAVQQERDDREALREMMAHVDLEGAETGEELSWLKPGYQNRVLNRLRRGHYAIADTIDLHHMDVETAKGVLLDFIDHAIEKHFGCIRIIHGKGLRSRGEPLLKVMTNRILWKHPRVVAYASCRPVDGGTGATLALISVKKRGAGK